jgi:hypothetical protein
MPDPTMLIELVMYALVATFVAIVVLGHVLLAAAIIQCVREDLTGGRRVTADGRSVRTDPWPRAVSYRSSNVLVLRRPSAGWSLRGWLMHKLSAPA